MEKLEAQWEPKYWSFYSEGNNNVVLRYIGPLNEYLSSKVLRIRKSTNKEFYTDPCLLNEHEYNKLMIDNVLSADPILSKYIQESL
jgi:hypothetical protein